MYKQFTKRYSLLWSLLCIALLLQAQIPAGYYSSAKGKKGKDLKTALFEKISYHDPLSYDALWNAYKTTDVRADGKIWDMYSNITNYSVNDHGGGYSKEGDMFNREHSFPKSWFNNGTPMYTDLFHLYPTDGYVNGRRSNFPFGENNGEIYSSAGGFSKLGKSTTPGYSGTVFEPNDEYKGDFARSYFYMATAYEDKIASWSSPMLAGNAYPAYTNWAITMLLRWAEEDPVSQKEIDRNNAVYKLQHNRNPYIDYPGLEQYVWGRLTSTAFDPDNYNSNGGGNVDPTPDPTQVAAPTFSPTSGVVAKGTEVTISTTTEGATVYYTLNQGDIKTSYMSAKVVINANTSITAYAMLGQNKSQEVTATYTLPTDAPVGENVYTLVTDAQTLVAGQQLLIVSSGKSGNVALGGINTKNNDIRDCAPVEVNTNNTITTEVGGAQQPFALTLGGSKGQWSLYDQMTKTYLGLTQQKNKLESLSTNNSNETLWTITISADGTANIQNVSFTDRIINYNDGSPRFATYTSTSRQKPVSLYRHATATAIAEITNSGQGSFNVYNTQGHIVCRATSLNEALKGLSRGIYIINGNKVLIK